MNIHEYHRLALRTVSAMKSPIDDLVHGSLGMAGEAGEIVDVVKKLFAYDKPLDKDGLLLEIGDCFWYCNLNFSRLFSPESLESGDALNDLLVHLTERVEGFDGKVDTPDFILISARLHGVSSQALNTACHIAVGKSPEQCGQLLTELLDYTVSTVEALLVLTKALGSTLDQVFDMNIRKLEKRYPDLRFNADHAINRDTDAEEAAAKGASSVN
jgi:NTP pyrophosphatase (non-canonical NTP hydrolase)